MDKFKIGDRVVAKGGYHGFNGVVRYASEKTTVVQVDGGETTFLYMDGNWMHECASDTFTLHHETAETKLPKYIVGETLYYAPVAELVRYIGENATDFIVAPFNCSELEDRYAVKKEYTAAELFRLQDCEITPPTQTPEPRPYYLGEIVLMKRAHTLHFAVVCGYEDGQPFFAAYSDTLNWLGVDAIGESGNDVWHLQDCEIRPKLEASPQPAPVAVAEPLRPFCVGDRVYDKVIKMNGRVKEVDESVFPIHVFFENKERYSYTEDGKLYLGQDPRIRHADPKPAEQADLLPPITQREPHYDLYQLSSIFRSLIIDYGFNSSSEDMLRFAKTIEGMAAE